MRPYGGNPVRCFFFTAVEEALYVVFFLTVFCFMDIWTNAPTVSVSRCFILHLTSLACSGSGSCLLAPCCIVVFDAASEGRLTHLIWCVDVVFRCAERRG